MTTAEEEPAEQAVVPAPEPVEEPAPAPASKKAQKQESAHGKAPAHEYDVPDEIIDEAGAFSYVGHASGKNVFVGSRVIVYGNVGGGGGKPQVVVHALDITTDARTTAKRFIEPTCFEELVDELGRRKVAILGGPGSGRSTTAAQALLRAGRSPILFMPVDVPAGALIDAIRRVCSRSPNAGIIIESVDDVALAALRGFEQRRFFAALGADAALVFTTGAGGGPTLRLGDVRHIVSSPPEPEALLARLAEHERLSDAVRATAEAVLALLPSPIAPATVLAVLDRARTSEEEPELIAAEFASRFTDEALDEWLGAGRTAREIAGLTVAAALEGVPIGEVDRQSVELCRRLDRPGATKDGDEEDREPKLYGRADRGWPEGLVEVGRDRLGSHLGPQSTDVVKICAPHNRERVLRHLWRTLDPEFRAALVDWLREIPGNASSRVAVGAARTAGVLFDMDPLDAESALLRPWALSGRAAERACAALAVGVPLMLGHDPGAARGLVNHWSTIGDLRLRAVAVTAYGTQFGASDPGTGAAAHLWRIGAESPPLRAAADGWLVGLMAAGEDAGRVRRTVVAELDAAARQRTNRLRAYGLLVGVARRLTRRDAAAKDSRTALFGAEERPTLRVYARLVVAALMAPAPSSHIGTAVLMTWLEAAGDSRADDAQVADLVRAMKAEARDAKDLKRLGARIERVLRKARRQDTSAARPAAALMDMFFPTIPQTQGD